MSYHFKNPFMKVAILFFAIILLSGCNKDDDTPQTLPEATQTGRGIFACYVNGKPFIDNSGSPNSISFNCFYQLVNEEYYFGIQGGHNGVDSVISIRFSNINFGIQQSTTYNL